MEGKLHEALDALYEALDRLPVTVENEALRVPYADLRRRAASLCVDLMRLRNALEVDLRGRDHAPTAPASPPAEPAEPQHFLKRAG